MKDIVTSYLNRRAPWTQLGFTRLRICRWVVHESQHRLYDKECADLYPTKNLILEFKQGQMSHEDWEVGYCTEVLGSLDPLQFYEALPDKAVLLCHEKSDDRGCVICHRRLVADWITEHIGIAVPEWLPPETLASLEQEKLAEDHLNKLLDF